MRLLIAVAAALLSVLALSACTDDGGSDGTSSEGGGGAPEERLDSFRADLRVLEGVESASAEFEDVGAGELHELDVDVTIAAEAPEDAVAEVLSTIVDDGGLVDAERTLDVHVTLGRAELGFGSGADEVELMAEGLYAGQQLSDLGSSYMLSSDRLTVYLDDVKDEPAARERIERLELSPQIDVAYRSADDRA